MKFRFRVIFSAMLFFITLLYFCKYASIFKVATSTGLNEIKHVDMFNFKVVSPSSTRTSVHKNVTVLFWTPLYGDHKHWYWWFKRSVLEKWCPENLDCEFTIDRNKLNESAAIVFHGFRSILNASDMPLYRYADQRWVFFMNESPQIPLRNLSGFNGLFNWTMSFRKDSDIFNPYGELIIENEYDPLKRNVSLNYNFAAGKNRLIAWFVSHCETSGRREHFVEELRKHVPVDIYGDCGSGKYKCNRTYHGPNKCAKILDRNYKFYLSFENHLCDDYVTEKFFDVITHNVVPIVFQVRGYDWIVPSGSYLNAMDFATPKDLADYLLILNNSDILYNKFFAWKRGKRLKVLGFEQATCRLCSQLKDSTLPAKIYPDLNDWWNTKSNCHHWENNMLIKHV